MTDSQQSTSTGIPPASTAGILLREFGCPEKALEFARRKARGQGPVTEVYEEAANELRAEIARVSALAGLQARANARDAVAHAATELNARLSAWRYSAAPEWEYATLTVGEAHLTVGASTGGVISVNGQPFTGGELIQTAEHTLKAVRQHLQPAQTPA